MATRVGLCLGLLAVSCASPEARSAAGARARAPTGVAAPSVALPEPPELTARPPLAPAQPLDPPAPPPRRPGAWANTDPSDDFDVGPPEALAGCEAELEAAGVKWVAAKIPVHTEKARFTCGAPQVVMYLRGPAKIAYEPPPVLTCRMALALAAWEKIVSEEAERTLHTRVARIEQLGTYNCRVIPTAPTLMSEHGYANAIDIGRIYLANGHNVDIYRDFDKSEGEPRTKNGTFLRAISRRANDEDVFSHVLTPFFDEAHNNHFHLDLARFRRDGTR